MNDANDSKLTSIPVAVARVVQVQAPTSSKPGDMALICSDGSIDGWVGGGCVQPAIVHATETVLASGEPCLLRVAPGGQYETLQGVTDYSSGCLGRGALILFVEPLQAHPTLCVMGQSPVAISLASQAIKMNLHVVLQAPDLSNESLPASIVQRTDYSPPQAQFIVIATQGKGDRHAIYAALESDCPHIKMVVSERKLNALKEQLSSDGMSEQVLTRLQGPAGIAISAHMPNEIALSVLAEIIQIRRTAEAGTRSIVGKEAASVHQPQVVSGGRSCCGS